MSRLSGDRNLQQQINQNQQIVQSSSQQHSIEILNSSALPSGSFIIVNSNSNDGIPRTSSSSVNINQNSISHLTSPVTSSSLPVIHNNSTNVQFATSTNSDLGSTIAKKRLKLEVVDSSSSCGSTNTIEDLVALKARILEHKFQRLKVLVEK